MTTFHSTKNCKLEHIKKELATALRTIITMNAISLSEQSPVKVLYIIKGEQDVVLK
jgi:hypothetical protein